MPSDLPILSAAGLFRPTSSSSASGVEGIAEVDDAIENEETVIETGEVTLDALIQAAEAALATKTSTIVESGGGGGLGSTGGTYAARPAGVTGAILYVGADDPTTSSAANSGAPALATDVWLPYGVAGSGGSGSNYVARAGGTTPAAAALPFFNVTDYGAVGDGVTDDTSAIQVAVNAAATGGGIVTGKAGATYLVSWRSGTVGTGGNAHHYCLTIPSGVTLSMPGCTIRVAPSSRSGDTTALSVIVNADPNGGDINVSVSSGLTIDCNRTQQGPYAYRLSLATPAVSAARGVSLWNCTGQIGDITVQNCADIGVFVEANTSTVTIGNIRGINCVGTLGFDSGVDCTAQSATSVNSDTVMISTTSTSTVTAGTSTTVTPSSMTGITVGTVLAVDLGSLRYETVLVTAITSTTFTAFFANAHTVSWSIYNGMFNSDSATQINAGCVRVHVGHVAADYTAARSIAGPALEILGCPDASCDSVDASGTWGGAWLHSFLIGGAQKVVQRPTVGRVSTTNLQAAASGVIPNALFVDDNGFTGTGAQIFGVNVGQVRDEYTGVPPSGASTVAFAPSVIAATLGAVTSVGAATGIVFNGCQNVVVGTVASSGTQWQGVVIQNGANGNIIGACTILNPGQSGANGQGIRFIYTGTSNNNAGNVFGGVSIKGVTSAFWAIDLSGGPNPSSNRDNTFVGDVSACANGFLSAGGVVNHIYLTGGSLMQTPTSVAGPAVGTSPPAPSVTGADTGGILSVGTGASTTTGVAATVTFDGPLFSVPAVTISAANAATAALQPYVTSTTVTGFSVGFATAPATNQPAASYSIAYARTP